MHKTTGASSVWGSLSGSSTRPEQNKSYLTVPAQLMSFSRGLAFCFSSAKLCDQSAGPRQRPRLAPRLIRHLASRAGNWGQQRVIRSGCVDRSASRHEGGSVWGVGGLCISLCFTHAWRAWAWIHLSSSPCSLPAPVYLYLILPAWLNLWEAPVLAKAPPAETKAKRQSSLYRWHTNAETENILSLENTHTRTNKIKQAEA